MRFASRSPRIAVVLAWTVASGCTTLREVPRAEYAAREERKDVVVDTRDGQHHTFDYARFASDTLTGYRRRDTGGAFEEFDTLAIPLESVAKLSARRLDWYRTGLVGGAGLGAVILAALARHGASGTSNGGAPCPEEPCP